MNPEKVYDLSLTPEDEKPAWQRDFEAACERFADKPNIPKTYYNLTQAIAGPVRAGLRAGALTSRVWDVVQTESDVEAGNVRVFPRTHTAALFAALVREGMSAPTVRATLVLEGATEAERTALEEFE